jgi:hypothetical protein
MPDIDYQNESQVEQLLAFREVSKAYGQTDNVRSADKQLAAFGITSKADRQAAAKHRAAAAEAEPEAKQEPPAARQAPKKQTAAAPAKKTASAS